VLTAGGVDATGRPLASLLVKGHGVSYSAGVGVEATVTLGGDAGTCFTALFPGAPGPKCEIKAGGATLRCR
jgi:hypothetical protein